MADTSAIVVLDSSDDDEEIQKVKKTKTQSNLTENLRKHRISPSNRKRKAQQNEDEPTPKRLQSNSSSNNNNNSGGGNPEESPNIIGSPHNFFDGVSPLIANVTTPSATPPLQLLASPPRNSISSKESLVPNLQISTKVQTTTKEDSRLDSPTPKAERTEKVVRRVKLTTVLKESDEAWQQVRQKRLTTTPTLQSSDCSTPKPSKTVTDDNVAPTIIFEPVMDLTISPPANTKSETKPETKPERIDDLQPDKVTETRKPLEEKPPLEKEYQELINACREADPSPDMDKLIQNKLLKYYYSVHPDFVKSRGFRKSICSTIERIRGSPELVYYNLKTVVDELNARRKSKDVVITNDEATLTNNNSGTTGTGTGNKHTDEQIKKLNKALYILTKRIERLDQCDVDLDDDDSTYLQVERFKKRACQIYEKICDLTGESKNARRLVKKPIQFSGTTYPAFNKTLQAYINRTKQFPDYLDVLRMLEHCNRQYNLKLASFEIKRIAQDAFIKVGKILQSRRKTDLYETVAHFTANFDDPATSDPNLLAKLNENLKTQTKISEIIEKYARAQDDPEVASSLLNSNAEKDLSAEYKDSVDENGSKDAEKNEMSFLSDDSDDNDDEEDGENLDAHVEKLTKDNTIILSEGESDMETTEIETKSSKVKDNNNDAVKEVKGILDKDEEKEMNKEKDISENKNVQLTENNNIMRTKTNDNHASGDIKNGITTTATIPDTKKFNTVLPDKSKSNENTIKPNTPVAGVDIKKSTISTEVTRKTPSTQIVKQRTIAEIVISDEE